jgi:hypothetical protein
MARLLFSALTLLLIAGCGGSQEPVIPDQPDPPPANGPSKDGLPAPGGVAQE